MKLYNLDHSPYASRVRIQIRKKALPVEIVPPPVPLRSPEFTERFPMGKLPVLELDDGQQIPESWTIMEYLEDIFSQPSLRPAQPMARAQMGLLGRCADNHLGPGALFPMFSQLTGPGGISGKDALLESLDDELQRLQRLLAALPAFQERGLHLGDIAMVPHMAYVLMVAPAFGRSEPLADVPVVRDWWQWVQGDEAVAATTEEMQLAFQAFADNKKK